MKKIFYILILLTCFSYLKVDAAFCTGNDLEKLQGLANNIKINYEVDEKNGTININLYNITKDLFLLQTDDNSSDKVIINFEDTSDGKYTVKSNVLSKYINYTFQVYSNINACDLTLVKTITYKKPKMNPNAQYKICADNPTVPICEKWITEDVNMSELDLIDAVNKYLQSGSSTITSKVAEEREKENFFKDNWLYILIGVGVIGLGTGIYVFINKKRSEL